MITKWYEVTCDYCGACLNHYIGRKPTMAELVNDGFVVTATKVFCDECCHDNWNHDCQEKRHLNLCPDDRIHNDIK